MLETATLIVISSAVAQIRDNPLIKTLRKSCVVVTMARQQMFRLIAAYRKTHPIEIANGDFSFEKFIESRQTILVYLAITAAMPTPNQIKCYQNIGVFG